MRNFAQEHDRSNVGWCSPGVMRFYGYKKPPSSPSEGL